MTAPEKNRLDIMEEKFDTLEDKVDNINDKVNKMLVALVGDELHTSEGLIARQKKDSGRIDSLEKLRDKVVAMSIGAGIAGGIGLSKLFDLIKEVIK